MAELTQKENLQPSLLHRLTDDEPDKKQESRDKRVLTMRKLRQCVLEDLSWLLNTTNLQSVVDLDTYPEVKSSALNYGLPSLAGSTADSMDHNVLQRKLRQAIWDYEPRILRHSVNVKVIRADTDMKPNALAFEIEGDLWAEPLPQRLYLKTVIDLESCSVEIDDMGG